MRKTILASVLVVLLCSMNVSVVLADGEAPTPLTWSDSTNDAGSQVDMSGLQGTEVQVQINTGNGGKYSMMAGKATKPRPLPSLYIRTRTRAGIS